MTASAWRCPKCGRRFANRNQWHSCGSFSVDTYLGGASPRARDLYRRLEAAVRGFGPTTLSPTKTSVGFKRGSTFAAAKTVKDGLRVGFLLDREVESPRFVKAQRLSPRTYEHVLVLRGPAELDSELKRWLEEAYRIADRKHRLRRG